MLTDFSVELNVLSQSHFTLFPLSCLASCLVVSPKLLNFLSQWRQEDGEVVEIRMKGEMVEFFPFTSPSPPSLRLPSSQHQMTVQGQSGAMSILPCVEITSNSLEKSSPSSPSPPSPSLPPNSDRFLIQNT